MSTSTLSLSKSKEKSWLSGLARRRRISTVAEQFGTPGSSLTQAWRAGLIDRREYEAGRRMTALWQASGHIEQKIRLAAGRVLVALGENIAYVVASVCRDNCGVGNGHRASLLKQGLSRLALHFAVTAASQNGGSTHV
jgi:hypothetical protein